MEFYEGDTVTNCTNGKNLWIRDKNGDWNLNSGGYLPDSSVENYLNRGALTWVKRGFKIGDKAIVVNKWVIYTRYEDNRWRRTENSHSYLTDADVTQFVESGTIERVFSL